MNFVIEKMASEDWSQVRAIYLEGIETGNATFEADAPDWIKWDSSHFRECRLVARVDGKVVGWAALSAISDRCVYAGVAEVSIYVASHARGKGIGKELLRRLAEQSDRAGIWTLQAGIFPENRASIALHEAIGFRIVGVRERLGQMNGIWRDVALLERRSKIAGT